METNTVSQIFAQLTLSVKLVSIWVAVNFPFKSPSDPVITIQNIPIPIPTEKHLLSTYLFIVLQMKSRLQNGLVQKGCMYPLLLKKA